MERQRESLAERFGLHRRELRAWALYDWANSAFVTTIIAAVFPIYYGKVAAAGLDEATAAFRFSITTTISLALVALMAPPLGALADVAPLKKRLLFMFQTVGVGASAALALVGPGDWALALVLFAAGNLGIAGAFTFYDSLLPHIARPEELDRVSTAGYALGYLGGGLLLGVNLVWIQKPAWFGFADSAAATRASFVSVAVWWVAFSIPLFRHVPEPRAAQARTGGGAGVLVRRSFEQLGGTLRELRRFRNAFLLLVAFLIYNDGISTIIRMASLYGSQAGIASQHLILALLLVQFVGVPCAFLFGRLAVRIGAKRALLGSLAIYVVVSVLGYRMRTAADFYLLAALVGMVQGGSQALSRSLFASMIPRQRSSEFFGFFAVFEKFAGILGPALFASAIRATGSARGAILWVIVFFVAGGALLLPVDVRAGERVAREAERELERAGERP